MARTRYLTFEDQPAIVIERFDRIVRPDGSIARIHQEDMCQAFGLDPVRKYESDGGPGVKGIGGLLSAVTNDTSKWRFARAVIANQLIGAPDAHAKNYSIMLIGARASLAPLYDVATGLVPDAGGRLRYRKGAMSVGGERRFGDVEARHWGKFAGVLGLDPGEVEDTVADLSERLPEAFDDALSEIELADANHLATTAKYVHTVCEASKQGLSSSRRHSSSRPARPLLDTLSEGATRPAEHQGRVGRGVREDGQFSTRAKAEPDVRLDGWGPQ